MDVLYIHAKAKNCHIEELLKNSHITGKFAIVTTIQFIDEVNELKKKGYYVFGQILGCNITNAKISEDFDAYLYIGTGRFHPLFLAFSTEKQVYTLDPITKEFSKISEQEKNKYIKKKQGMLAKYYAAEKIGIIVSVKSGQNQMKRALRFKETCGKEAYLFLCDTIRDLENFPDIDCWVNTACVRIFEDDLGVPLVNIRDVER